MSENPVVEGINVTVGGNATIQIAANITEVVDGVSYNYPADFSDYLNISDYESYDYLSELAGLSPVSTSDGEHWFYATYYQPTDAEVLAGEVVSGTMKSVSEFGVDDQLELANLTAEEIPDVANGHYVYMDFWVVSPMDYELRIATSTDDNENDGSFLIDLLVPQEVDSDGDGEVDSYSLSVSEESSAASARVGFLTSSVTAEDEDLLAYVDSEYYNEEYITLMGQYQEQSEVASYTYQNEFMIYEPNGDLHIDNSNEDYIITEPIGLVNDTPDLIDVQSILSVQLSSKWYESNGSYELSNSFLASVATYEFGVKSITEITDNFYITYLQEQVSYYVDKGAFITDTTTLYEAAVVNVVDSESMETIEQSGATDTTYIASLEADVPQRIRMFIWIEGQDVDCTTQVVATDFAVGIEFAGSNE